MTQKYLKILNNCFVDLSIKVHYLDYISKLAIFTLSEEQYSHQEVPGLVISPFEEAHEHGG